MRQSPSSSAAKDASGRSASRRDRWQGLFVRAATAAVLAPPTLLAIFVGSYWLQSLLLCVGGALGWEWSRICGGGAGLRGWRWALPTATVVVLAVTFWISEPAGAAALLVAACGMLLLDVWRRGRGGRALWLAGGFAYLCVALIAFAHLRAGADGLNLVLWLLFIVWATDIFAYFAGRSIGGPRLWPAVSPKKTWAGVGGGTLGALVVGLAAAAALQLPGETAGVALLAVALSLVAQAGDLAESYAKRRFDLKDASGLLPGHGGLSDRVDGLAAASLLLVLVQSFTGEI